MTAQERRRARQTCAVGVTVTAVVLIASMMGWLEWVERGWYDARARWFQYVPAASVSGEGRGESEGGEKVRGGAGVAVVHIDDAAIEQVGRWPWPRANLAQVVRELDEAGAAVVGLDLLFNQPQQPRFAVQSDGTAGEPIHDDDELASALADASAGLLPVSLRTSGSREARESEAAALAKVLADDLSVRSDAARQRLMETDVASVSSLSDDAWTALFLRARRRAMRQAAHNVIAEGIDDWRDGFKRMLPGENAAADTTLRRAWQRAWQRAMAERAVWRFGKPLEGEAVDLPRAERVQPPITLLGQAADAGGFVDWSGEGAVRSLPLWVEHDGRAYPQFGLAAAMATLGVEADAVRFEDGAVVLGESAGGEGGVRIPTHQRRTADGEVAHEMVVPWVGPAERWELMFDAPRHADSRGHISLAAVWEVVEAEQRLRENEAEGERAVESVLAVMDPAALEQWREERQSLEGPALAERRRQMMDQVLADESVEQMVEFAVELREEGEELDEQTLALLEWYEQLERVVEANETLRDRRQQRRQWLAEQVAGKAVLVGWTATGAAADFVATPLHTACPGVVVHATVAQSVLSGRFWRQVPRAWGWLALIVAGLAVTVAVAMLSPSLATVAAGVILLGWVLVDGLLVFDVGGRVMAGAGPIVITPIVWGACVGWRYLVERMERARITRRFSSYVDPALVRYVLEHPEQGQLRGEVREMSVAFTDLAGFTTLSEQLGGQSVELLNEYMGRMVPLIRQHGGFVNKFLGDGIMFFYGAPEARPDHAAGAVATVLAMQQAMEPFNAELAERGLGPVGMRAGVATGTMIVGDAGPPDASDYTVLGDTVNLAARLESANKAIGTSVLVTGRTVALMGERWAARPIATLQVVGKAEGVMVYEPIGEAAKLDADAEKLIAQTRQMVEAYQVARFEACLEAADALAHDPGSQKLVALYRKACEEEMERGEREDFEGRIVLSEK